jgi:hypothetical protein
MTQQTRRLIALALALPPAIYSFTHSYSVPEAIFAILFSGGLAYLIWWLILGILVKKRAR